MDTNKKIFPISNQSACVFKWGWTTFRLYTGVASSCHRVESEYVTLADFDNFPNQPKVLEDRSRMLQGQWPESGRGCEYCQRIESVGGESDRTYHNRIPGLTPVDFHGDNIKVTPRILEIYLNNTCDLACVYCVPSFSSKINEELKKFGPLPTVPIVPVDRSPNHHQYLEKMLSWLDVNSKQLQRLAIQGGEPFLQKEFDLLISWLETSYNPDLELSVNTNLNSRSGIIEGYLERIKKMLIDKRIKRMDFTCSLDCWGPQQEYIRFGLDLESWKRNFEMLIKNRWLYINVQHCITSLSIATMADMQKQINEYKKINPKINQSFQTVDGPNEEVYSPMIFGPDFFKADLQRLLDLVPEGTDQERMSKARMVSIADLIAKSPKDIERLNKLKTTLDHYTVRRQRNWQNLFPHIDSYFNNHGINHVV